MQIQCEILEKLTIAERKEAERQMILFGNIFIEKTINGDETKYRLIRKEELTIISATQ